MELRILNIAGPLIKVSITDGRRLISHYIGFLSFFMAVILKPSNWRVGPKRSSVYILILNQGCPINNIIPLPESPKGGAW